MRAIALLRSTPFRLSLALASLFAVCTVVLFAFIYWQTAIVEESRIEREQIAEVTRIVKLDQSGVVDAINRRVLSSSHKLNYAGLFQPTGEVVTGNLDALPDAHITETPVSFSMDIHDWVDASIDSDRVIMAGVKLPDGRIVVIGRSLDSLENLRAVVLRALELGMVPAVILALMVGFALSHQSHSLIRAVNASIERIMQGNLHERLPVRGNDTALDGLSSRVNFMLDKIEQLVDDAKSTGDNIAHDLRTPLTRVRSRLERAGTQAKTEEEFRQVVDHAITGLDQALRITTALLRIGQIERHSHRSQFSRIDIGVVISEIGDLFEPIAEERNIRFAVNVGTSSPVEGDRDLLSEAVANLVDNALKFTPPGGLVLLEVIENGTTPVIRVIDNGPGIPPEDQEFVTRRFFRSDKSRHIDGNGLGLSIVAAIIKYHGFGLSFHNLNPGCVFEIACRDRG